MAELGDALASFFVALVKARAKLLAAAGLCLYFTISFIELAREVEPGGPLFWLSFTTAVLLAALGCAAVAIFVLIEWRESQREQRPSS